MASFIVDFFLTIASGIAVPFSKNAKEFCKNHAWNLLSDAGYCGISLIGIFSADAAASLAKDFTTELAKMIGKSAIGEVVNKKMAGNSNQPPRYTFDVGPVSIPKGTVPNVYKPFESENSTLNDIYRFQFKVEILAASKPRG